MKLLSTISIGIISSVQGQTDTVKRDFLLDRIEERAAVMGYPDLNKQALHDYGCYCFKRNSEFFNGAGSGVDRLDKACKTLTECYKCNANAAQQARATQSNSTPQNGSSSPSCHPSSYHPLAQINSETKNVECPYSDQCDNGYCSCDNHFVDTVLELIQLNKGFDAFYNSEADTSTCMAELTDANQVEGEKSLAEQAEQLASQRPSSGSSEASDASSSSSSSDSSLENSSSSSDNSGGNTSNNQSQGADDILDNNSSQQQNKENTNSVGYSHNLATAGGSVGSEMNGATLKFGAGLMARPFTGSAEADGSENSSSESENGPSAAGGLASILGSRSEDIGRNLADTAIGMDMDSDSNGFIVDESGVDYLDDSGENGEGDSSDSDSNGSDSDNSSSSSYDYMIYADPDDYTEGQDGEHTMADSDDNNNSNNENTNSSNTSNNSQTSSSPQSYNIIVPIDNVTQCCGQVPLWKPIYDEHSPVYQCCGAKSYHTFRFECCDNRDVKTIGAC